ncbi:hypothetical protein JXA85_04580, partial [Candidatus Woesearchaeota archaeon]|nr:hypothetical protein [Candidatus Woesearchaeota archaeon]
ITASIDNNTIVRSYNTSWITTNQIYGVNGSSDFGGDVTGKYNALDVLTTNGLSFQNITDWETILTSSNTSFVTKNQIYGLNVTTNHGGDVNGTYDVMQVLTTQGLSATNITADTVDGAQLADTIMLDANLLINNYNMSFDNGTLFIDQTHNRVGTGTISPKTTFQVEGTINATDSTGAGIRTDGTGNVIIRLG